MSTIQEQQLSRLRCYITSVKETDPKLAEEISVRGFEQEIAMAVAKNILVTNRHVAREFAVRRGNGFTFKMGISEQMAAGQFPTR
jgi:hypothetical protein